MRCMPLLFSFRLRHLEFVVDNVDLGLVVPRRPVPAQTHEDHALAFVQANKTTPGSRRGYHEDALA